MSTDTKSAIRRNSGLSKDSPKFLLKQQSTKNQLRTPSTTTPFIDTHYSISLREKYLKQGPLTNDQKKFLNMVNSSRVTKKSGTSGFI